MADVKISELTAQASANVDVSADVLALVDTSATQTKKISVENLLSPITIDKSAGTITSLGTVTGNVDFNGDLDVDGTTNLDAVDIDGAVDMADTLTVSGSTGSNYIGSFTNTSATGWGLFVKGGADNADYTLRIQDKDADDLFSVKAGGHIGVATNDPQAVLEIRTDQSRTAKTGTSTGLLHLDGGKDDGSGNNGDITAITFTGRHSAGTVSSIIANELDTDGSHLLFGTSNTYASGVTNTAMEITPNSLVIINENNTGSAGTSNKSLSLGGAVSTQFDRTNVGTMTGIVVSNSYGDSGGSSDPTQSGTATGIVFTHHTSSSGISYIASVSGSQNGDRSALHFGTRGSSGVKERFMLNDNGEVKIGHGGDGYLYHYQINSNAHVWTIYAHSDDSYRFNRNGSGSDEMRIESDGDVVILGNLTQNSDIRLKENIETIPNALSKVNQLRGVTYNWNETSGRDTEAKQIGMIADEVEEILPELVKVDSAKGSFDEDGLDNIKSLKYGNVVGLLIEAVKELTARIEALEA